MATSPTQFKPHHQKNTTTPLLVVLALSLIGLLMHGPIHQPPHYHDFVDSRTLVGIPNACCVLSNLPFLIISLIAARQWTKYPPAGVLAWLLFAFALFLTSLGSTFYHLNPSNTTLVFDRLPIALACASLTCAFLAQRVHQRWASPLPLIMASIIAVCSVLYWRTTDLQGNGDLRPYLLVQFLPMLLIPLHTLTNPTPRFQTAIVQNSAWYLVLLFYAFAKAAELADAPIYELTHHYISGHTLKHLLAAAAAYFLIHQNAVPATPSAIQLKTH